MMMDGEGWCSQQQVATPFGMGPLFRGDKSQEQQKIVHQLLLFTVQDN